MYLEALSHYKHGEIERGTQESSGLNLNQKDFKKIKVLRAKSQNDVETIQTASGVNDSGQIVIYLQ